MPNSSFSKVLFLVLIMTIVVSGCSINFDTGTGATGGGTTTDGGIYKSVNKGTTWQQKASILTVGSKKSMNLVNIISLAQDPQDNKAIYAGSAENGLFFSYDAGEGWQSAASLGKLTITNVAVDPADKCLIYATAANKVYKSIDCSRTWSQIYFDTDLKVGISSLVIENSNNIFIGTSRGEIIKSSDRGLSWKTLKWFGSRVHRIVINQADSKNIFVGTTNGIFRSTDAGANWESLTDRLKDFNGGKPLRDLVMVKGEIIFLVTNYGLLESTDQGDTWSKIALITPAKKVVINAIAVNPGDANEIYYVTDTTFYRSLDGGKNWLSSKLPTSRAGQKLLIDKKNPSIIYLAAKQLEKN